MSGNGGDSSVQNEGSPGGKLEAEDTSDAGTPGSPGQVESSSEKQPCTAATPKSKDHKDPLCMISMFLGGLSFYIVNGLFHKFPDQIFQLGDKYRSGNDAGSVIPNKQSMGELIGLQSVVAATNVTSQSPDQGRSSVGRREEPAGAATQPKPKDHGGSPGGQEAESADTAPTPEPPKTIDHKDYYFTDITFDICDTITITGDNADTAIDFGNYEARKKEDSNKGIDKLFKIEKIEDDPADQTEGDNPKDTGHVEDWSSIHQRYWI